MPVVRSHWPVVGPGGVVSFTANGGTLVSVHPTDPALARVQVGIDAAVVADHHVTIRSTLSDGQVQLSHFHVPPTIALLRSWTCGCRPVSLPLADIRILAGEQFGVGNRFDLVADAQLVAVQVAIHDTTEAGTLIVGEIYDADDNLLDQTTNHEILFFE